MKLQWLKSRWMNPSSEKQNAFRTHSRRREPTRLNGFRISAREFIHRELFGTELDGILDELTQVLVG
jgi:hypothetical protein